MNRYSPFTCNIKGDIARADAVGLHLLCEGKSVVEFGVGASTGILARCARSLVCYDTSAGWITKAERHIKDLTDKTCEPRFVKIGEGETPDCPSCDMLWIDGLPADRPPFMWRNFGKASEAIILHGALRHQNSFGHRLLEELMDEKWEMIKTIEIGYLESHLLVVHKRKRPLHYYNYHYTEADNNRSPC